MLRRRACRERLITLSMNRHAPIQLHEQYFPTHPCLRNGGTFAQIEFILLVYMLHVHAAMSDPHLQEAIEVFRFQAQRNLKTPLEYTAETWRDLQAIIQSVDRCRSLSVHLLILKKQQHK